MDVNWCLTCAKRTVSADFVRPEQPRLTGQLDARNPYCSESCRQADLNVSTTAERMVATTSAPISRPVFTNAFSPSPKNAKIPMSTRPPLAPLAAPLIVAPTSEPAPRDRRAFSFPAEQMFDTPTKRRDSMFLPAFARKPQITHHASTTNASPAFGARKSSLQVPTPEKLSKSTGANTPLVNDSVFCSTSESSDNEGAGLGNKLRLTGTTSTARPTTVTRNSRSGRPSLPAEFSKSAGASLRAPSYLTSREYALRKKSQSPVSPIAGAIASSSSSRSREDIISWAKAVKSRPGDTDTSEDELKGERGRGRSRTRKDATVEPVRETAEEEHLATTPKGRMESVFGGLTIGRFGVGPIVKALTSVTGSGAPQPPPFQRKNSSSVALTSAPAPAAVSKVAVVSSTASGNSGFAIEDNQLFFGGATPTLSTVSLSEVNDPTSIATDTNDQDHADLMTNDDQSVSAASSSHHQNHQRRRSAPMIREAQVKPKQQSRPQTSQASSGSMRPVQSTASVIWNISTYLRSFAPFSLPPATTSTRSSQETSPNKVTPSTEISEPVSSVAVTSPVPASRMPSRAPSPDRELVRSLPMDIIAPMGGGTAANEDRARNREAQEYIEAMGRRSRSRRNSPKRQSRSPRRRSPSPASRVPENTVHIRQWSYDADQSGTEDEGAQQDERRGRSPHSKALISEDETAVKVELFSQNPPAERSWSRSRDAVETRASRSRGRRESPRSRGRDRTIRAI